MWKLATELKPDVARYWYGLGALQTDLGNQAEARAALHHALQLDPGLEEAQALLQKIGH